MDSNNYTTTSSTWDLDMGNPLFLDQFPYDLDYPMDPLQYLHLQSSSHLTTSNFPSDHLESHKIDQEEEEEGGGERLGAMKEMMYKIAAMQPVDIDPSTIRKPKRRNVRISDDPQSVAARHRREKISERIRILQRLVPGGTKMDTASMLDEAIRYVKFLKKQVQELQSNQQSPIVEFDDGRMAIRDWQPLVGPNTVGSTSSMGSLPRRGLNFRNEVIGD